MAPTRAQAEPDDDLRALFRRTAPDVAPVDVDALLAHADARRPLDRRLAMTIRISAAALVATAAAAALTLFVPRPTSAGFDLADVERQVTTTKTVTMTQVDTLNGKPGHPTRLLVSGPSLLRSEADGGYSVTDFAAKKALVVDPGRKHALLIEGGAFQVPEGMNFYVLFREIARKPTRSLPGRELDGRRVVGFVVQVHGHDATVWADAETRLPVRIEVAFQEGRDASEHVMKDIAFDRPLDASLFSLEPPAGYEVEARGVATLAAEPNDPALAAPTLTPGLGIGPARFGMTTEEVIKVLGKPDREFTESRVTFLSYYSRGFELTFLPADHPRHGLNRVAALGQHGLMVKVREFRGKTDRGIGLGASRAEVERVYGRPDFVHVSTMKDVLGAKAEHPEQPTGQSEIHYNELGLSFTFYQDRLYNIGLSAPRPEPAAKK